jgi:uncharacterized membrane protein YuzA (DUF378 family)
MLIAEEKNMVLTNIIALIILILGAINWLCVGVFSFNLLTWIFGMGIFVRILYAIVGLAGIWFLLQLIVRRARLFRHDETMTKKIG